MKTRVANLAGKFVRLFVVISAILWSFIAIPALADQDVTITTLYKPISTPTSRHTIYAYELRIQNMLREPIELARVEVSNDDKTLAKYAGNKLNRNVLLVENNKVMPHSDRIVLKPKGIAYVFVYLKLPKTEKILKTIKNKVWLLKLSQDKSEVQEGFLDYDVDVSEIKPLVIGYPMKGGEWVAMGGVSPKSYHRRAILGGPFDFHLAQRYAIDWLEIYKGRLVQGNMNKNKNWFGYGEPVLAVADGVVTKIHDGVSLNTPPNFPTKLDFKNIIGNYIIEKVVQNGKNYYVLYAHLQPRSLKVKVGTKLKQGQVIGSLGNTGNSSAPHLHLHVSNNDSFLKGEGIPFIFNDVKVLGQAQSIFADYGLYKKEFNKEFAGEYHDILPTEDEVIQFPDEK